MNETDNKQQTQTMVEYLQDVTRKYYKGTRLNNYIEMDDLINKTGSVEIKKEPVEIPQQKTEDKSWPSDDLAINGGVTQSFSPINSGGVTFYSNVGGSGFIDYNTWINEYKKIEEPSDDLVRINIDRLAAKFAKNEFLEEFPDGMVDGVAKEDLLDDYNTIYDYYYSIINEEANEQNPKSDVCGETTGGSKPSEPSKTRYRVNNL